MALSSTLLSLAPTPAITSPAAPPSPRRIRHNAE
jgi:hypothetical protein